MRILKFNKFLLEREALRDELQPHQIKVLKGIHGKKADKYLNMDTPQKSENIKEGTWKLSPVEKNNIINLIFDDISAPPIAREIREFTEHIGVKFMKIFEMAKVDKNISFSHIPQNTIELTLYLEKFYGNNFYSINVKETLSTEKILRDSKGVPVLKDGKIQKVSKARNEVSFNMNNKTNFNNFFEAYCDIFGESENPFEADGYVSDFYSNTKEFLDLDLLEKFDMELYITSKPSDILNMSISKFYDSCQNLYNGDYRNRLLGNIFDINMKVAYLIFNTPFTDKSGNVNPVTSVARCIIRNIRGELYFDRVYPDLNNNDRKITTAFHNIITKYTGMKSDSIDSDDTYYYTAPDEDLNEPYQDNLSAVRIVIDDKLKALSSFLKIGYEYIKKNYRDNIYDSDYDDRSFYVVDSNKDDFTKTIFVFNTTSNRGKLKRELPYTKLERKLLINVLDYFNFKKFARLDGIKGDDDTIKSKVREIINEHYSNDVLAFVKENEECLDIKKIILDKYPYFTITATKDGKCHSVEKYNIYEFLW